ncbi:hypothetical protein ACWF94_36700 [Streptomyces sp. NPDC055078]
MNNITLDPIWDSVDDLDLHTWLDEQTTHAPPGAPEYAGTAAPADTSDTSLSAHWLAAH